jgi:hypothetical protein
MKALRESGKRFLGGALVCAGLATLSLAPMAARAGGLTPTIGAAVQHGSIIHVMGARFVPGSTVRVLVRDDATGKIVAQDTTIATRFLPPPPPPCTPKPNCLYLVIPGGTISTDLYAHVSQEERATVTAYDLGYHQRSNSVTVTLGV